MDDYSQRIRVMRDIALTWQKLYKTERKKKLLLLKAIERFDKTRNHKDLSALLDTWRDMKDD